MNDSPPLPSGPLKVYAACAKWFLWLLAAAWLLLALGLGALHAWIVPRIGEMRPALEAQASRVLGVPVRIGALSAGPGRLVPSLQLESVVLLDAQGREALRLPRVVAALSPRSLWNLGFDQLYIERPVLEVRRSADGHVWVAGLDLSSAAGAEPGGGGNAADWVFRQGELVVRGGTLHWTDEMRGAPPLELAGVDVVVRNSGRRHALRLDATPPAPWGERFTVQGIFRHPLLSTHPGRWQAWDGQLHADLRRVDLGELRRHVPPLGVELHGGHGAVRAWVDVADGQVTGGALDVAAAGVSTTLGPGLQPLALATVDGRLAGKRSADGFELQARQLQFTTAGGQHWPAGDIAVSWSEPGSRRGSAGELRADRLDLAVLGQLAGRLPLGGKTHAALERHAPQGLVEGLQLRWQGEWPAPRKYQAKGRIAGLHVSAQAAAGTPGVRNAGIEFDFDETGGKARVAVHAGALELPGVFEDPLLPLDRLTADAQWEIKGERIRFNASNLKFANADAQGEGQASWRTGDDPAHRFPGVLDLQASLSHANGARVWRYLPLGVPKEARDYVRESVLQAQVTDGRFRVRGDLRGFPFDHAPGEFHVTGHVKNATYAFVPKSVVKGNGPAWPALAKLSGRLVFDRAGMRVEDASGVFTNAPNLRVKATAEIPDLSDTTVGVTGEVKGPLAEALGLVQRSPLAALTQDAMSQATGTGPADVKLRLSLPIARIERSKVQGTVTLAGNDVQMTPESPLLQRARGAVTFSERGFALVGTQARSLGGDVRIEGGSRSGANEPAVLIRAQGTASADGLRQARELGFVSRLAAHASGASPYSVTLAFRRGGTPELLVTSSLQGLKLDLPAPLAKPAEAALPLRYETALLRDAPAGALQDRLTVEIGRVAAIQYVRDVGASEPQVLRGSVAIGLAPGETAVLPPQGVTANVRLGATSVDAWEQVLGEAPAPAPAAARAAPAASGTGVARPERGPSAAQGYLPTLIALRASQLTVEGRTLHNVVVGGSREGLVWRGNVDADELSGYVEYRQPAGNGAGRLHARLARASIAAAQASAVEAALLGSQATSSIPALDVVVDDFELRGRKLGRLEIEAINRGGGAVVREGGVREWRLSSSRWPCRKRSSTPPATGPRSTPRPRRRAGRGRRGCRQSAGARS